MHGLALAALGAALACAGCGAAAGSPAPGGAFVTAGRDGHRAGSKSSTSIRPEAEPASYTGTVHG